MEKPKKWEKDNPKSHFCNSLDISYHHNKKESKRTKINTFSSPTDHGVPQTGQCSYSGERHRDQIGGSVATVRSESRSHQRCSR